MNEIQRFPKRVIVTGGAGFVGSHVVERLLAAGSRVLVIDNLSTGRQRNLVDGCEFFEGDIGGAELWQVVSNFKPDAVVHAAAQASVPVSMEQPQLDARTNILGGINLAQVAMTIGCEQFIYINTGGALYGNPRYLPVDEDHPVEPLSPYGLAKWTMERYLELLLPAAIDLKVLRLANVYGPRQSVDSEAGVVATFGLRMLRGQPVVIHGDGEQTRDFVYVGDVADACLRALGTAGRFVVNISSGQATSVNALAREMVAMTGYHFAPEIDEPRAGDIRHSVLSNRKAAEVLGWAPAVALGEGLERTLAWLRQEIADEGRPAVSPQSRLRTAAAPT